MIAWSLLFVYCDRYNFFVCPLWLLDLYCWTIERLLAFYCLSIVIAWCDCISIVISWFLLFYIVIALSLLLVYCYLSIVTVCRFWLFDLDNHLSSVIFGYCSSFVHRDCSILFIVCPLYLLVRGNWNKLCKQTTQLGSVYFAIQRLQGVLLRRIKPTNTSTKHVENSRHKKKLQKHFGLKLKVKSQSHWVPISTNFSQWVEMGTMRTKTLLTF